MRVCVSVLWGRGRREGDEGDEGNWKERMKTKLYPNALSGFCKVLKFLRVNFFPILIQLTNNTPKIRAHDLMNFRQFL